MHVDPDTGIETVSPPNHLTPRGLCVHPCEGDCAQDEWKREGSDGVHERYSCQEDPFSHLPGATNKGYFESPYCGAFSLKNCPSYEDFQSCNRNSAQCDWSNGENGEPLKQEIRNGVQEWWWEEVIFEDNGVAIREVIEHPSDPVTDAHQCLHKKGTGESTTPVEDALAQLAELKHEWFTQCLRNSAGFLMRALAYCMVGCDWVTYDTILEDCIFDACTAGNFAQAAESRMQCQENTFRDLPWDQKKCNPGYTLSPQGNCVPTTCSGLPCNPDRELCFETQGDPTCYIFEVEGTHSEVCLEYECKRWNKYTETWCPEYDSTSNSFTWLSSKDKCLTKCHETPTCRGCYKDGDRATQPPKKCTKKQKKKKKCSGSKAVSAWLMIDSLGCSLSQDTYFPSEVSMKFNMIPTLYYT